MTEQKNYLAQGDFVYRNKTAVTISQSEGPWLMTNQGKRLLDLEAANGSAGLGYDETILMEACKQVTDITTLPSFFESDTRVNLATRLGSIFKSDTGKSGKVAFDLGGAQGIELALKIAKLNTTGRKIFVLEGAYHGRSISTSQLSCSQRYRESSPDAMMNITRLPYPEITNTSLGLKDKDTQAVLTRLALNSLTSELSGNYSESEGPMALVIEPLLNVSGLVFPNSDYVRTVVDTVRRMGGVIIIDEVFTGLYRTGTRWGFMQHDIEPDIVVASKALTNGILPLSIVWAKDPLATCDNYPPGTHSVTFGNSPISLAVADTVLKRYERLMDNSQFMISFEVKLKYAISRAISRAKGVKNWSVVGGTARIVLENNDAFKYREAALYQPVGSGDVQCDGIVLASTGVSKNTLGIHPPYIMDDNHFSLIEQSLYQLLR